MESIAYKHNLLPITPSPALPLERLADRPSVIALERFWRAAVHVFGMKAQIPVSGCVSTTLGSSPPTREPNVPLKHIRTKCLLNPFD